MADCEIKEMDIRYEEKPSYRLQAQGSRIDRPEI